MDVSLIVGEASPLTWPRWRQVVAVAERCGFRALFRSDHYFNGTHRPTIDPYLSFVAAALETTRLRFGPLVSPVTFREPVNVGRMAQQLDALSDGRFILGLGAGWYEAEHATYGIDFPPRRERYDRLDEALSLLKVLWYDTPGNFDGRFYRLSGTDSQPHPPPGRPEILIGGKGPQRTLAAVARHAHHWNSLGLAPADYAATSETLDRHCAAIGRDPAEIRRSMLLFHNLAPDKAVGAVVDQRIVEIFAPGTSLSVTDLAAAGNRVLLTGGVHELVDTVGQLARLGLQEVVFEHFATELDEVPEFWAETVLPQLRDL